MLAPTRREPRGGGDDVPSAWRFLLLEQAEEDEGAVLLGERFFRTS